MDLFFTLSKYWHWGFDPRICTFSWAEAGWHMGWRGCSGSFAAERALLCMTAATLMSLRVERPVMFDLARLWLLETVSSVKWQMEQWRIIRGGQTPWAVFTGGVACWVAERTLSLQTTKSVYWWCFGWFLVDCPLYCDDVWSSVSSPLWIIVEWSKAQANLSDLKITSSHRYSDCAVKWNWNNNVGWSQQTYAVNVSSLHLYGVIGYQKKTKVDIIKTNNKIILNIFAFKASWLTARPKQYGKKTR